MIAKSGYFSSSCRWSRGKATRPWSSILRSTTAVDYLALRLLLLVTELSTRKLCDPVLDTAVRDLLVAEVLEMVRLYLAKQ